MTEATAAWRPPLAGRVAIVTGAGRGIGKAVASEFIRQGAAVAVVDVVGELASTAQQELVTQPGACVLGLTADVAQRAAVVEVVSRTRAHFGRLDILVNNAGVSRENPNFLELSDEEWQTTLGVNLTGAFLCSQLAARVMVADGRGGAIINIASLGAFRPSPGGPAYQASKGGLVSLTRALAVNLAPYSIRVNALAPGVIQTAMTPAANSDPQAQTRLLARIPADRFGHPNDVAGAAVFLASDAAAYITGQVLAIDGGAMVLGLSKATKPAGDG